ncbi:MAG: T9SS type A sorting domain-containing protein [Candidatus Marinimicrobia bacterium]|nr:T9SS type A sorting domain-containing protein [Candidatus Neomarinimicrobiota bacterium]MCF7829054.1 T9SS type A sorting domain-containing protein [Candidatus Neomarinimicrobiota bacterium]MCF7881809.1 T9SS type A sorting domain-containing protein [Candidatus Neomarinimicrobiota bacterium]
MKIIKAVTTTLFCFMPIFSQGGDTVSSLPESCVGDGEPVVIPSAPASLKMGVFYIEFADADVSLEARGSVKSIDNGEITYYSYSNYYNPLFTTNSYNTISPDGRTVYGSFMDYCNEVSYSQFSLTAESRIVNATVNVNGQSRIDWFRAPYNKDHYINQSYGVSRSNLVQSAQNEAINAGLMTSGEFDVYAIVYANGRITSTADSDGLTPNAERYGDEFMTNEKWGGQGTGGWLAGIYTFTHEFGHMFGFLDHRGGSNGDGLGDFSLMATWASSFGWAEKECPPHLSVWEKMQLDWLNPQSISSNLVDQQIPAVENTSFALVYDLDGMDLSDWNQGEYFIIENRQPIGFDYLYRGPNTEELGGGLLVYHKGTQLFNNGFKVKIIEADGTNDLDYNYGNTGDLGDFFPGTSNVRSISAYTAPNTDNQDGTSSHFAILNIGDSQATMTADIYPNYYEGSHSWSGTITESMTWAGTATITDDLYIDNNSTLTILPGTTIEVDGSDGIKVRSGSQLKAIGTSGSKINFDHDGSGKWTGIRFYSGSSGALEHCNFEHFENAVVCFDASLTIQYCDFKHGTYQIKGYGSNTPLNIKNNTFFSSDYGSIYLSERKATVEGNDIDGDQEDTELIKVVQYYGSITGVQILDNDIYNSLTYAIRFDDSRGVLRENDIYNNGTGVRSYDGGDPRFWQYSDEDGLNVITDNTVGVAVHDYSDAYLDYSWSTIAGNSSYNVYNDNSSITVLARDNYWGAVPPPTGKFYGSIDYTPYEDEDKTDRYPTGFQKGTTSQPDGGSDPEMLPAGNGDAAIIAAFQKARGMERAKQYTDAIPEYRKVVAMNPDHDLAVMAFRKYMGLRADRGNKTTVPEMRSMAKKYEGSRVAAWALRYQANQASLAKQYGEAVDLCHRIVKKYPETRAARDALYKEWVLTTFAFDDSEGALTVIKQYETQYGVDENLIDMQLTAGLIDSDTAHEMKNQYLSKPGGSQSPPAPATQDLPTAYALLANFPNPFNPTTTLRYALSEQSAVSLQVYDLSGRLIQDLVHTDQLAGYHTVEFEGNSLPSGMYLYRMTSRSLESDQQFTKTGRMLLLK